MQSTLAGLIALTAMTLCTAAEPIVLNVWPVTPPGDTATLPPEADLTKDSDKLIAGRRIIKLGNVTTPQLAVYRPAPEKANGTSVIICPGGGFNILAYDLEGTEVAAWLNTLGVTGIVLKYRVPSRDPKQAWLAPVQDAQRAVSLVRAHAAEWGLDPQRVGILGFSAGGTTAAYTSLFLNDRRYATLDKADQQPCRPDFTLLIYTGGFFERYPAAMTNQITFTKEAPSMFLVHAFDDGVSVENSLHVAMQLKKAGGSAELHVYDTGGHGYGLRPVAEKPVTQWPARAEAWLARRGWLQRKA